MIEPFSILGIIIIAIIVLSVGHMLTFVLRALFYALLVVLVLVIVFGISLEQVVHWAEGIILWAL